MGARTGANTFSMISTYGGAISGQIQSYANASQINDVVIDFTERLVVALLIPFDKLYFQLARALGAEVTMARIPAS